MLTLHFDPQNDAARDTLRRTLRSRHLVATALHRDFPDVFGAQPFLPGDVPARLLAALEGQYGELSRVTRECLVMPPQGVLFVRDGLVVLHLNVDGTGELADRIQDRLHKRLVASSLGEGEWRVSRTVVEPSLTVTPDMRRYVVPVLDLPVDPSAENDNIEWVEDALGDALYAAVINQALAQPQPAEAIKWLPARRSIEVSNSHATRLFRSQSEEGYLDLMAYSWVTFEANVAVQGPVFIGEFGFAGSGLILQGDRE